MKKEPFNISREIAQKITSIRNQHETAIVVGDKGKGKSWGAISFAWEVAQWVAKIKGGKPEDYFSFENIAIITKNEVIRVLKFRLGQYYIIILDDIGVGWSNRDFQSKFNKVMNNIFQVFRTRNVFLILTVPDQSYIDKLPRHGSHYLIEVVDSYFDDGFIAVKIKEQKKIIQTGMVIHPFVIRDGVRYPLHLIATAPDFITGPYEIARKAIEKESSDKGIAELEALELDTDAEPKEKNTKANILRPSIFALFEQDKYTQKEIAQKVGCSQQLVSQVLSGSA